MDRSVCTYRYPSNAGYGAMLFSAWGGRRVGCQVYLEVRLLWVQILALQLSSCVIWGQITLPLCSNVLVSKMGR